MNPKKIIVLACFSLLFTQASIAQQTFRDSTFTDVINAITKADSTSKLLVTSIQVAGNKKTKNYIILREVPFKQGDSLTATHLQAILTQTRSQVYNTNLFSEVTIIPVMLSATEITINITVREKWYIYPTPQFQLVDRNFNDWWKTYNADFSRVIYGVKFVHYNFSGRGDQLRIYLLNGYARNVSFSYIAPASNSKLNEGFRISAGYTQNREIPYKTTYNNQLKNFKKPGFVRNVLSASASYQLRKGFFNRHLFTVSYNYINLHDSIITSVYNPHYLNSDKSSKGIIDLAYNFSHSNTDNVNYPLKGTVYGLSVVKRGFGISGGINMLSLSAAYSKYLPHGKNWYSSLQLYSKITLPFKQPYLNQRAIGYSEFYLRGLEYYVIDGVAAAVAKYTLRKKLFSFDIKVPFHIRAIPKIPFAFYAKTYADGGYSYIQNEFNTRLNNRFLYTGGFGIDVLSLYDLNVNFEYSFNQLGENGLFLHARVGF